MKQLLARRKNKECWLLVAVGAFVVFCLWGPHVMRTILLHSPLPPSTSLSWRPDITTTWSSTTTVDHNNSNNNSSRSSSTGVATQKENHEEAQQQQQQQQQEPQKPVVISPMPDPPHDMSVVVTNARYANSNSLSSRTNPCPSRYAQQQQQQRQEYGDFEAHDVFFQHQRQQQQQGQTTTPYLRGSGCRAAANSPSGSATSSYYSPYDPCRFGDGPGCS